MALPALLGALPLFCGSRCGGRSASSAALSTAIGATAAVCTLLWEKEAENQQMRMILELQATDLGRQRSAA